MATPHYLAQYQSLLSAAADPIRAAGMAAYMKHQFAFMGIPTPNRRKITAVLELKINKELDSTQILALVQQLYQQPEREYRYSALDLLERCHSKLGAGDLAALENLVTTESWWDTVDAIASKIIGPLVKREPSLIARMDELVSHPNLWLRRTAILYQLGWKAQTDQTRLFHACLANAADKDFFIRKAIGWALRQHARVAPDAIKQFVSAHQTALSPLSQREALKHLGG